MLERESALKLHSVKAHVRHDTHFSPFKTYYEIVGYSIKNDNSQLPY